MPAMSVTGYTKIFSVDGATPLPPDLDRESVMSALMCSRGDWSLRPILLDQEPRRSTMLLRTPVDNRAVVCSVVPTEFLAIDKLGADWDRVVFTPAEVAILDATRLVEPRLRNLTFSGPCCSSWPGNTLTQRSKAEVATWLAWQCPPGGSLCSGAWPGHRPPAAGRAVTCFRCPGRVVPHRVCFA
jgi:hypothetical protein